MTVSAWGLLLAWGLYYAVHSLLAADGLKQWVYARINGSERYYRLGYNTLAGVGFLALIYGQYRLGGATVFSPSGGAQVAGALLVGAGAATGWLAFRGYSLREFAGFTHPQDGPPPLNTGGLNAWVRHPLYFATLLVVAGTFLLRPTWFHLWWMILTIIYLWIGSGLEEGKLIRQHGKSYLDYRSKVARLVPFIV